jgi:hypothetical protein
MRPTDRRHRVVDRARRPIAESLTTEQRCDDCDRVLADACGRVLADYLIVAPDYPFDDPKIPLLGECWLCSPCFEMRRRRRYRVG